MKWERVHTRQNTLFLLVVSIHLDNNIFLHDYYFYFINNCITTWIICTKIVFFLYDYTYTSFINILYIFFS